MNYTIDHDRTRRIGFPEVVFGESKDSQTLIRITDEILSKYGKVLITKLQTSKYDEIKDKLPKSFHDPKSGICIVGNHKPSRKKRSDVAILSGGTSDEFVVNEAFYTLEFLGLKAEKFIDIGVAGVHRLMKKTEDIKKAKVLIVCAGFEGALPTVVGGLFPQPIIGVPISVGYGVAKGGTTALNSMLSSCANGLTVTNIDNGYGAAIAAYRILNRKIG
ncbi:MAG: nickel pincer cofactor biosynthesis protein LarB [Melioribacteraceae bacterium]|nr:nickel pincer cofactor biosynthesis protein LarB [Melioribacteraceae bacterium]